MNILNIEHVSKVFGEKTIFDDVSFGIQEGDKIGIIGINGTGKTTLLRMIAGVEEPDSGQIIKQNGIRLAYLSQHPSFPEGATVLSYAFDGIAENDWALKSEVKSALNKLGITDHDMKMEHLSGGQKKKVALAKTLTSSFEILLLDEPTNHLDGEMISWLEDYLKRYKGVVIMVTHDRYFHDNVTNRIVELDRTHLYSYDTNYSGFLELKPQREQMEMATEEKRQNILRRELEWIRRGCQARSTKQQARIDRYEDMKEASRQARASFEKQAMEMNSVTSRLGKKTIELENITKAYDGITYICDLSYIFLSYDRIGFIGRNGCGKSTLMKIITGQIQPDSGTVSIGETVKIGYFMQENEPLDEKMTVLEYVRSIGEYVTTATGKATASLMCERFLFTPKMQWTPIEKLSGGEKRRLYLLSVLMSAPNVLILDEPTNVLDIETLEILEDYLDGFAGIVITVSHDRYFLDRIVDRIFAFEENGILHQYEGGFSDYYEKSGGMQAKQAKIAEKPKGKKEYNKDREKKLRFSYKEQKEYEVIDEEIAALEQKIAKLDSEIEMAATQYSRLTELTQEKSELEEQLEFKMNRWVELNELAELIEQQKQK